ncbi:flagellar motor protein MotB [Amphibiibacter pelophylacis]|uniref:Flagellar motor protein MotB n=1 Tax=Amphibiibacter pelophylacis TaxID=1799477 RepID=A0ACC6P370_9BURK
MAGDTKKLQPIIVKKIKKGGHAAHGGAWKIAYADFVTAMMAFFLLMWLLGSTSNGDKAGIADYFNQPLRVALMGGDGAGDATSIVKGGGQDLSRQAGQVKRGDTPSRSTLAKTQLQQLRQEQLRAEVAMLTDLKEKVESAINLEKLAPFRSQILMDMTREGLRIQIVDSQNRPMFDSGSARVKPYMLELLRALGGVLATVPNYITIEGHTDAVPLGGDRSAYTNWELSADRANASRRELILGGLPAGQVLRVQGLADSIPLEKDAPTAPINRRISLIVMNQDAAARFFRPELPDEGSAPEAPAAAAAAPAKAGP